MQREHEDIPRIVQLARQVELDIRRRGLRAGDPYFTTAQTARMLGVSTTTANRALQFLASNGRLDRRQRRGTFVAEPSLAEEALAIARVHLVLHRRDMKAEGLLADGVIVGLQSELPGVDVSFNFVQPGNEAGYVNELIGNIMQAGQPEGIVLVRANLEVQRMIAESGLPAVVYGTPYRSIRQLPHVDADQGAIGTLATRHALAQGCQRLLVIMRDQMLPGDHPYLDAIHETAGRGGLTAERICIRCLARDRRVVAAEVRHYLQAAGRPAGILCRDEPLANTVLAELKRLKLPVGDEVVVVVSTIYRRGNEDPPPIPYTHHTESPVQIGEHLGRLLTACARQPGVRLAQSVVLPVALCIPEKGPALLE